LAPQIGFDMKGLAGGSKNRILLFFACRGRFPRVIPQLVTLLVSRRRPMEGSDLLYYDRGNLYSSWTRRYFIIHNKQLLSYSNASKVRLTEKICFNFNHDTILQSPAKNPLEKKLSHQPKDNSNGKIENILKIKNNITRDQVLLSFPSSELLKKWTDYIQTQILNVTSSHSHYSYSCDNENENHLKKEKKEEEISSEKSLRQDPEDDISPCHHNLSNNSIQVIVRICNLHNMSSMRQGEGESESEMKEGQIEYLSKISEPIYEISLHRNQYLFCQEYFYFTDIKTIENKIQRTYSSTPPPPPPPPSHSSSSPFSSSSFPSSSFFSSSLYLSSTPNK
jgi:hypothetical protein